MDLKSLVWYTKFFCLHKLGLKDWMYKASRVCRLKEFSALIKIENFSPFLFFARSWLSNKCLPIAEKYFFRRIYRTTIKPAFLDFRNMLIDSYVKPVWLLGENISKVSRKNRSACSENLEKLVWLSYRESYEKIFPGDW